MENSIKKVPSSVEGKTGTDSNNMQTSPDVKKVEMKADVMEVKLRLASIFSEIKKMVDAYPSESLKIPGNLDKYREESNKLLNTIIYQLPLEENLKTTLQTLQDSSVTDAWFFSCNKQEFFLEAFQLAGKEEKMGKYKYVLVSFLPDKKTGVINMGGDTHYYFESAHYKKRLSQEVKGRNVLEGGAK